jgi:hypothetical protein
MADTLIAAAIGGHTVGIFGPYWVSPSIGAAVHADSGSDLHIVRTIDGGATWSDTEVEAGTMGRLSVCSDLDIPGSNGKKLYVAWLDSALDDVKYLSYNISTGTLGTTRTISASASLNASITLNSLGITIAPNGRLIVAYASGTASAAWDSTDDFATPVSIANPMEAHAADYILPIMTNTSTSSDAAFLFGDIDGLEWTIKVHRDTEDDWTESAAIGPGPMNVTYRAVDSKCRHSDGHNLVAVWNAVDAAGADIDTYDVNITAFDTVGSTTKTDAIVNSPESAQVGVFIDQTNDDWYVAALIGGVWQDTTDARYVVSTNGGTSWSTVTAYSEDTADDLRGIAAGGMRASTGGRFQPIFYNHDLFNTWVNLTNDIEIAGTGAPVFPPRNSLKGGLLNLKGGLI